MLGEASAEIQKATDIETRTDTLREQFESDFDLYINSKFNIAKKEGEFESFTSNRASTDANKTINILASAPLLLKILIDDETKKQRKDLSKTEQFPFGVFALRDSLFTGIPEALPLQDGLAWNAVVRGWIGVLCYLFLEDDGKNGAVVPHIPVLDIRNTSWISGSKGLLWHCNKRYASQEDVKDQFGEDVKPDDKGRILLWNIWDKGSFGTAAEGNWLNKGGKPEEHDLGHIPALILPVGSTPYVQSSRHDDSLKYVGMNFASNNRHLYETESRMGSYLQTIAGEIAHSPLGLEFDSTKGGKPIELEGKRRKGATVPVDVGKGQKITTIVTPEMTRDAYSFFDYLQGRLAIGGHTPVAFGQINQALPAAGINILRHASMDNIKPAQRAIERAYEWLAHEIVTQYKSGKFPKMEIQGFDGSHRRFKVEVKPGDIDDSWNFEASLQPDMPQDEMANVGMAVQTVESEILSPETARDKYDLVKDTDLEQQKLDRHKAYGLAQIAMRRVAVALEKDGDEEGAQFILDAIEDMKSEREARKGVASQPGSQTPVRPSGTTTAATPAPPGDANARPSALRRFLERFGAGGAQR